MGRGFWYEAHVPHREVRTCLSRSLSRGDSRRLVFCFTANGWGESGMGERNKDGGNQ